MWISINYNQGVEIAHALAGFAASGVSLPFETAYNITISRRRIDEMMQDAVKTNAEPSSEYRRFQRAREEMARRYAAIDGKTGGPLIQNGVYVIDEAKHASYMAAIESLEEEHGGTALRFAEAERQADYAKSLNTPVAVEIRPIKRADLPESIQVAAMTGLVALLDGGANPYAVAEPAPTKRSKGKS